MMARLARRASYRESLAFGGLSSVSMMIVGLGSSVALARIYGITTIGAFALVQAPAATVGYLSTVREQAALVRRLSDLAPRDPRVTALFAAVLSFSTALTAVVAALIAGGVVLLYHGGIDQPELIVPALVLLGSSMTVQNVSWNLDVLMSAFRAGRELAVVRQIQVMAFLVLAVGLGLVWDSVWALVVATIGSWAAAVGPRWAYALRYMRPRCSRAELRTGFAELPDMLRFGVKLAPDGIANGLSAQIGTWLLAGTGTVAAVGAYSRAQNLGQRFLEANYRLSEVLLPTLFERRAADDREGYSRATVDSIRYSALALGLLAAVGGGAATGVLQLFGPGFDQASGALVAILLVPALAAVAGIQANALVAADRPLTVTATSVGRLAVTALAAVVLVRTWGITGAGVAWATGYVAAIVVLQRLSRRHLSQPLRVLWPIHQAAAGLLAYGAGFAVAHWVDGALDGFAGLVAACLLGTVAYVAVALIGAFGPRDRRRASDVRASIASRRRRSAAPAGVAGGA